MEDQLVINSATPIGSGRFYYELDTNKGKYYYSPAEFVTGGLLQGKTQYFDQGFLRNPDVIKNAQSIELAPGILSGKMPELYKNPNKGILMTQEQASKVFGDRDKVFNDWKNVIKNGGVVDRYEINEKNKNTGSEYGAIQGLTEYQGNLVYARPTEQGQNASYIAPYDEFDRGYSLRNTKVEIKKKGGFLGDLVRGVGDLFGSIPVIGDLAAFALGGPALLGVVKGGQAASAGKSPLEAFKSSATAGAIISGTQALTAGSPTSPASPSAAGLGGADAVTAAEWFGGAGAASAPGAIFGAETVLPSVLPATTAVPSATVPSAVEVLPVTPPADLGIQQITTPSLLTPEVVQAPTDYSLLGSSQLPAQAPSMGGGTGITAELPPIPEPIGAQPVDYSLTPQTMPGTEGGLGLQIPTMPNIGAMGGGQGITVPVEGGTVGQLGFTPAGATPVLGDPGSFINQPEVLGTDVLAQGTAAAPTISIRDALRGAQLVNSLLNPPQQPTQQQPIGDYQGMGATGVDYNALLSLLNQRASAAGLLGTRFQPQPINLLSLLG